MLLQKADVNVLARDNYGRNVLDFVRIYTHPENYIPCAEIRLMLKQWQDTSDGGPHGHANVITGGNSLRDVHPVDVEQSI